MAFGSNIELFETFTSSGSFTGNSGDHTAILLLGNYGNPGDASAAATCVNATCQLASSGDAQGWKVTQTYLWRINKNTDFKVTTSLTWGQIILL